MLPRRREVPAAGAGRQPAVRRAEFRRQAALRPAGQALASRSEPVSRRAPHLGVRAAVSACQPEPASLSERPRELEPLRPEARPDDRAAVYRDGQPALRRACCQVCCQEPALRLALVSVRVSRPELARRVVPPARPVTETALPWAQGGPEELPREAEPGESERGARRAVAEAACGAVRRAAAWARAAAPRRAAVPGVLPAVREAASGHAAAGPQPGAVTAASARQAAGVAAAGPGGPPVAAEAEVARPGEAVRPPAAAQRADGEVQLRAAARRGARAGQAARLLAAPSAAASVFRQGPYLAAGPARPRAAAHFALAMRSLRIASRSEPSSQAARNEDWSWW
ncbi:hypothetical protein GGE24_006741 [Bradyrhizobium centrosematis]|nr:hypothetical protein [Bradyrhizobium centrosematis]MCS3777385.1 hypothetical protein [Bradyrhizobium centrosematis]